MFKVLLVDDDEALRSILRAVLEHINCSVTEASTGESAAAFLERDCPDVLITDLVMPGLLGLDLVRRSRLINPGTKIIAMSGAGHVVKADYLKMASALGADIVLEKPFSPDRLITAMEKLREPLADLPPASADTE